MPNIPVNIKKNEIVCAYMPPYWDNNSNTARIDTVVGLVDDVKRNAYPQTDLVLIQTYSTYIPDWRIEWFTFGGVDIRNKRFDPMRVNAENTQILYKMRKSVKP